ncbi:MAG: hypothetical protein CMJ01_04710 [Pelagibacteraceae bacterium]|nr:hypothetical protein [Pelagibacteraceae bacterium]|tara:strand:+ start:107 stop:577 length:471 start_codon:yes stop_codon:yes gene_type:complete
MKDTNKHPKFFFDNLDNLKREPYRNVIQKNIKKLDENKFMGALRFEIQNFPKNAQDDLTPSEAKPFYLGLGAVFKDSDWWKNSSIHDAMVFFHSAAKLWVPYFTKNYPSFPKKLTQKQKNEMFGLYQICTIYISWNAMREKKLRVLMGIKKGIFLT